MVCCICAPTFASDFSALMHQKLGVYWADLWVASGASEADRKVYDELWEASNERAPSLRLSEAHPVTWLLDEAPKRPGLAS